MHVPLLTKDAGIGTGGQHASHELHCGGPDCGLLPDAFGARTSLCRPHYDREPGVPRTLWAAAYTSATREPDPARSHSA